MGKTLDQIWISDVQLPESNQISLAGFDQEISTRLVDAAVGNQGTLIKRAKMARYIVNKIRVGMFFDKSLHHREVSEAGGELEVAEEITAAGGVDHALHRAGQGAEALGARALAALDDLQIGRAHV